MKIIKAAICPSLLILVILACNVPSTALPTSVNVEQALTFAVQTFTAQAQVLTVLPTTAALIVLPVATISPTLDPSPTITPINPPTITFTASPAVPTLNVSTATNCRTGPGKVYEIITGADVGMYYEVVGKYTPDNYWIIKLPDGRQCWLWGNYATLQGNVSGLPEYAPPVGSIQGVVINISGGNPVKDALVTILPAGIATQTNQFGEYSFHNVPIGTVTVVVEIPYNQPSSLSGVLRDGETKKDFNFSLFVFIPGGGRATGTPTPTPTRCPLGQSCVPIPTQRAAP